jgi:hypothetical protein
MGLVIIGKKMDPGIRAMEKECPYPGRTLSCRQYFYSVSF